MKEHLLPFVAAVLSVTTVGYADRVMSRTEANNILQKKAATPTTTWLPAGTIEATHVEYRAAKCTDAAEIEAEIQRQISAYKANTSKTEVSAELQKMALEAIPFNVRYEMGNEYTMTSNVTLKYDGNKFYWSIKAGARTDSMAVPSAMKANYKAKYFNMNWNATRIFAWDGQKYTLSSALTNKATASADNATVDAAGTLPHNVNGPLTAGVIPWGYGSFTSSKMDNATVSAAEVTRDNKTQVDMTVQNSDGSKMTFSFDPAMDNAVTAYTWQGKLNKTRSCYYSGHKKVGAQWIPMTILVEQHDLETGRLLRSDKWDFTKVDTTTPRDFSVAFSTGARIEQYSPTSAEPAVYDYSNEMDTDRLLADQIAFSVAKETSAQNCATAALKYVASSFGKSVSEAQLSKLVGPDGRTSLDAIRQAALGLGLNARAVTMDLATLRTLTGCKAVLHMPGTDHFVVLNCIDGPDAWLVDLSSKKFCYRTSADLLPDAWSEGTALLLSVRPITGQLNDMDKTAAGTITGGAGWSCINLISGRDVYYCNGYDPPIGCDGYLEYYYVRYGCLETPSGTCTEQWMLLNASTPCIQDPTDENECYPDGEWTYYYVPACS
jgi:hypothetical protein